MKNQTPSHIHDLSLDESNRTDKPIRFIAKKNIYWDEWGHKRLVFSKGKGYSGILHTDGKVTAESPYYGVSDYVNESEIEILN